MRAIINYCLRQLTKIKVLHYIKFTIVLMGLFFKTNPSSLAQTPQCDNLGFVDGDLTGWEFSTGCHPNAILNLGKFGRFCHQQANLGIGCCPRNGKQDQGDNSDIDVWDARHTLMGGPGTNLTDKLAGFNLVPPEIPGYPKSEYSVRLGNAIVYGEADRMQRTFDITEDNAIFAYQFAFVLNDPTTGHADDNPDGATAPYYQLPYFEAGIYDENNEPIKCSNFIILANDDQLELLEDVAEDSVNTTQVCVPDPCPAMMDVRYKEWTPVFMDLTDYIGTKVTLRFSNADCARAGHFGYSYVSAFCGPYVPLKDTTICSNSPVTLKSPFPIEGFDLLWSNGANTEEITVSPNVTTTYTLRVKNKTPFQGVGGDCTKEYKVTVKVGEGITPVLENKEICLGASVTLKAEPAGGNYQWYDAPVGGNLIYQGDSYEIINVLSDLQFWVGGEGDCAQERTPVTVKTIEVNANAGPDVSICPGENIQLKATGGTVYEWSPPEGLSSTTISDPIANPVKTTTYIVKVTDVSGKCVDWDTVTVKTESIEADAGPDLVICSGDSAQLNASGGVTYEWSPPTGLSNPNIANPKASPANKTTYTVKVKDATGFCEAEDEVIIDVQDIEARFIGTNVCIDSTTNFKNLTTPLNLTNVTWNWDFGDGQTSVEKEPNHLYKQPGKYTVSLIAKAGTCEDSQTAEVEVYPNPLAAFTPTPKSTNVDNPSITFIDECELALKGNWNFGDGATQPYIPGENPSHLYNASHEKEGPFKYTIKLTVQSEHGCRAETIDEIIITNEWSLFVPNSFTPNGDGSNEYFKAYGMGILEFNMRIFNRWGEVVYKSADINEGWDGKSRSGKELKNEVYVWRVTAKNNKGKTINLLGHVSLLK